MAIPDESDRSQFLATNREVLSIIGFSICFFALFGAYLRLSFVTPKTSDDAIAFLQAQDILNGNVLLHGWTQSTVTYYTSIVPLYVLGGMFTAHLAALVYAVPPVIYALFVTISMALVGSRLNAGDRFISRVILLLVIGLFSFYPWDATHSLSHIPTTILVAAAFYLLAIDRAPILASLPLILAYSGDPFAIWIGLVPIALVGLYQLALGHQGVGRTLLIVDGVGFLISKLLAAMIPLVGGFVTVEAHPIAFVPLTRFNWNVLWFISCILNLFGANFFGRTAFSFDTSVIIIHFLVFLFVVWATVKGVSDARKGTESVFLVLLVTAVVVDVGAFLFSTLPSDSTTVRFLAPVQVFGGLIAAMSWKKTGFRKEQIYWLLPVVLAGYLWAFCRPMLEPADRGPRNVIGFLESHQLTEGYASYSEAGLLTMLSDGKIKVRQVVLGPEGNLTRLQWVSAEQWYHAQDARFLVFGGGSIGNVNAHTAIATWGSPEETKGIDGYTIMIWASPIHLSG